MCPYLTLPPPVLGVCRGSERRASNDTAVVTTLIASHTHTHTHTHTHIYILYMCVCVRVCERVCMFVFHFVLYLKYTFRICQDWCKFSFFVSFDLWLYKDSTWQNEWMSSLEFFIAPLCLCVSVAAIVMKAVTKATALTESPTDRRKLRLLLLLGETRALDSAVTVAAVLMITTVNISEAASAIGEACFLLIHPLCVCRSAVFYHYRLILFILIPTDGFSPCPSLSRSTYRFLISAPSLKNYHSISPPWWSLYPMFTLKYLLYLHLSFSPYFLLLLPLPLNFHLFLILCFPHLSPLVSFLISVSLHSCFLPPSLSLSPWGFGNIPAESTVTQMLQQEIQYGLDVLFHFHLNVALLQSSGGPAQAAH